MHILDSYRAEFGEALENSDGEQARLLLHAMLQRDPLDNDGKVKDALGEYLGSNVGRPEEPPLGEESEDRLSFIERIDGLEAEPLETEFGRVLLAFAGAPSAAGLKRATHVATRMRSLNLLEDYETELADEPDVDSSSERLDASPRRKRPKHTGKRVKWAYRTLRKRFSGDEHSRKRQSNSNGEKE